MKQTRQTRQYNICTCIHTIEAHLDVNIIAEKQTVYNGQIDLTNTSIAFSMWLLGNPISMIWETSGEGGGSSGAGLGLAFVGGVVLLTGGWVGKRAIFFCLDLLLPLEVVGVVVGVVVGGASGLCTSDARYWQTDTAAAYNMTNLR